MRTRLALLFLSLMAALGSAACIGLLQIVLSWIAMAGSSNALCLLNPQFDCAEQALSGRVVMGATLALSILLTLWLIVVFLLSLLAQRKALRAPLVQFMTLGASLVTLLAVIYGVIAGTLVDLGSWFFVAYDFINTLFSSLFVFINVASLFVLIVLLIMNSGLRAVSFEKGKIIALVFLIALVCTAATIKIMARSPTPEQALSSALQPSADAKDSPSIGDALAPVHIVAFVDFMNRRSFWGTLQVFELMKRYPGKIRVTFRNLPWDGSCNPILRGHPGPDPLACEAARAALCADQQGRFQVALETLFLNRGRMGPNIISDLVAKAGVDKRQLTSCMASPKIAQKLEADINDALSLELTDTPAFFVNQRQVERRLSLKEWQALIQSAR